MNYTFPKTVFSDQNSVADQLEHVRSEMIEVQTAMTVRDIHLELMDQYHSLETLFRILEKIHSPEYVDQLVEDTQKKNESRGYYV